jgi:hypothetical protein
MTDAISIIEYGLAAADAATLIALAVVLLKYGHRRRFPAFTAYICFSVANATAQIVLSRLLKPLPYFYSYWSIQVLEMALVVCVIQEVFASLTDRVRWLTSRGKTWLIRLAVLLAVIAVAASLGPPRSRFPVMEAITSLQRGLGLAILAFMGTFVVFARIYSIEWDRRDSGIAIGMFLAYSFRTLWPSVDAYLLGHPEQRLYRLMVPLLELLGSLVWLYVFVHDSRIRDSGGPRGPFQLIRSGKADRFSSSPRP